MQLALDTRVLTSLYRGVHGSSPHRSTIAVTVISSLSTTNVYGFSFSPWVPKSRYCKQHGLGAQSRGGNSIVTEEPSSITTGSV